MALSTLNETMQAIEKEVNSNPEPVAGMDTVYQFEIDGEVFQLQLKEDSAKILQESGSAADCTLIMSTDNFHKFLSGKLNGMTAFMTGKLKIQGDMTKALKLESVVKQYQFDI